MTPEEKSQTRGKFSYEANFSYDNSSQINGPVGELHFHGGQESEDARCLKDLFLRNPRDDKTRIKDIRGGLLEDSYKWILNHPDFQRWRDDDNTRLLWVNGGPGKGKTMLLIGIVEELERQIDRSKQAEQSTSHAVFALSYFFCQSTDTDQRLNNATTVLRSLIYLLVTEQWPLMSHLRKEYKYSGSKLFEGSNAFFALSRILTEMLQDPALKRTFIIIDALDECETGWQQLLKLIVKNTSISGVKWIISSRNQSKFEQELDASHIRLSLELKANTAYVSQAVGFYIDEKLLKIKSIRDNDERQKLQDILRQKAGDTFLWAALVIKELETADSWDVLGVLEEIPEGLEKLYARMLKHIGNLKRDTPQYCLRVLLAATLSYRPLHILELAVLAGLPKRISSNSERLRELLGMCGSFFTIQDDRVYIIHPSAKEYLNDYLDDKAIATIFPAGRAQAHRDMFLRSVEAMSGSLERDIYRRHHPGFSIDDVEKPDPDPLASTRYSCVYWVDHLCNSLDRTDLHDENKVHKFIEDHLLNWVEALSLCRGASDAVIALSKLERLLKACHSDSLLSLALDLRRFVLYHKRAIEKSPLQVYSSALVFSPTKCLARKLFEKENPRWITISPAMEDDWSPCLQTLEGHHHWVTAVTFSHDSKLLASASHDQTVKIWEIGNSECLQTLKGHNHQVTSVIFSHDSKLLASSSYQIMKIWDINNGCCLRTIRGHNHWVTSITFSFDSTLLASASYDQTVKIWNSSSGKYLQTLGIHNHRVTSITFSHNSKLLASASYQTIKIWDTSSGKYLQTLQGHNHLVTSIAFSHDSKILTSASYDQTVKIWEIGNDDCLRTLEGHSHRVMCVSFSHDSKLLASSSYQTIKIWNTDSGNCQQTLQGHNHRVTSIAFSHNSKLLASASYQTIKIWDTGSGQYLQTLESHNHRVTCVTFSYNSKIIASASYDRTIKIWDTGSGECLQTLQGHIHRVTSVTFSQDSIFLASASYDQTVKIWKIGSNGCLYTLEGHNHRVMCISFSHDSKLLASLSYQTVKIWDTDSGNCLHTLQGHYHRVTSITFSHDSKLLALSSYQTIRISDTGTGNYLPILKGHTHWVTFTVFSHDSELMASASHDETIRVWDVNSGQCLQTLKGHSQRVTSVAFSHDSKLLASTSHDETIRIWDVGSGTLLQIFPVGRILFSISFDFTGSYLCTEVGKIDVSSILDLTSSKNALGSRRLQGYGISSDGSWITWNSENLLWLPPEYRPSCFAVLSSTVCIGCDSGRVLVFCFDSQQLLSLLARN